MITKLLTPQGNTEVKDKIEELSGDQESNNNNGDHLGAQDHHRVEEGDGELQEEEEEELDWYFEQVEFRSTKRIRIT